MLISNNSECYVYVRLGGTDPPNSAVRSDRVIGPYSQAGINGRGPFAFAFTTNPSNDDLYTVSSAMAGAGSCQVEYNSRGIVEYVSSLPGAVIATGSDAPGYKYPWGHIGENLAGDWGSNFNAKGWQGLRVTMGNESAYACRVQINIRHFGAGGFKEARHDFTIGPYGARSVGIPLPQVAPNEPTDDLEVSINVWSWAVAPEYIHITPVLTGTALAYDTFGGTTGEGADAARNYYIDVNDPGFFNALTVYPIIDTGTEGEGVVTWAYLGPHWFARDPGEFGIYDYDPGTGALIPIIVGAVSTQNPGVPGFTLMGQQWGPVPFHSGYRLVNGHQLVYYNWQVDSRAACRATYIKGVY